MRTTLRQFVGLDDADLLGPLLQDSTHRAL
jgi:hypothetical protein